MAQDITVKVFGRDGKELGSNRLLPHISEAIKEYPTSEKGDVRGYAIVALLDRVKADIYRHIDG